MLTTVLALPHTLSTLLSLAKFSLSRSLLQFLKLKTHSSAFLILLLLFLPGELNEVVGLEFQLSDRLMEVRVCSVLASSLR